MDRRSKSWQLPLSCYILSGDKHLLKAKIRDKNEGKICFLPPTVDIAKFERYSGASVPGNIADLSRSPRETFTRLVERFASKVSKMCSENFGI